MIMHLRLAAYGVRNCEHMYIIMRYSNDIDISLIFVRISQIFSVWRAEKNMYMCAVEVHTSLKR